MAHSNITRFLHYDVKYMRHLFVSTAIRLFGAGMIGVFVPLIIYNLGLDSKTGLSMVLIFFILTSFFTVLINIFGSIILIHKLGTKVSMIIGTLSLLIYQNLFIFLEGSNILLYIAPLFLSIFGAFFWTAFHLNIAGTKKVKGFGKQIAKLNIIITLTLSLGPLIGGYLLDFGGILPTILIANVFVIASIVPLLLSYQKHVDSFGNMDAGISVRMLNYLWKHMKDKTTKAFAGKGYVEFAGTVLWPLIVFMVYKKFSTVGIIITLATVVAIVLIYLTGKMIDKNKEGLVMKYIVRIQFFIWIIGILSVVLNILNGFVLSFIDTVNRFTKGIGKTCIEKKMYDLSAIKESNVENVMLHEFGIHALRVVSCLFFLLINLIFGVKITIAVMLLMLIFTIPWQYGIFKKI